MTASFQSCVLIILVEFCIISIVTKQPFFTFQGDSRISAKCRDVQVEDLWSLTSFFGYSTQTFVLAVNLLDRFLAMMRVWTSYLTNMSHTSLSNCYPGHKYVLVNVEDTTGVLELSSSVTELLVPCVTLAGLLLSKVGEFSALDGSALVSQIVATQLEPTLVNEIVHVVQPFKARSFLV